jgi:hypothetical protein
MKKSVPDKRMGFILSISTNKLFQIVETDILGLLTTTSEGNYYILTFMETTLQSG